MALLKPRPLLVIAFWVPLLTSTALAQQPGKSSEEDVVQKTVAEFSTLLITLIGTTSDNTLLTTPLCSILLFRKSLSYIGWMEGKKSRRYLRVCLTKQERGKDRLISTFNRKI